MLCWTWTWISAPCRKAPIYTSLAVQNFGAGSGIGITGSCFKSTEMLRSARNVKYSLNLSWKVCVGTFDVGGMLCAACVAFIRIRDRMRADLLQQTFCGLGMNDTSWRWLRMSPEGQNRYALQESGDVIFNSDVRCRIAPEVKKKNRR